MSEKEKIAKKQFRWRYFIDKPFQLRFLAKFAILILVGAAISIGVLFALQQTQFNELFYFQLNDPDVIASKTIAMGGDYVNAYFNMNDSYTIFDFQLMPIVYTSILYLALILIFGLFISHKMAGPVYRIKKTLSEINEGNIKLEDVKFQLRQRDELHDLVDALNEFLDKTVKK